MKQVENLIAFVDFCVRERSHFESTSGRQVNRKSHASQELGDTRKQCRWIFKVEIHLTSMHPCFCHDFPSEEYFAQQLTRYVTEGSEKFKLFKVLYLMPECEYQFGIIHCGYVYVQQSAHKYINAVERDRSKRNSS